MVLPFALDMLLFTGGDFSVEYRSDEAEPGDDKYPIPSPYSRLFLSFVAGRACLVHRFRSGGVLGIVFNTFMTLMER